MKNLVKVNVKIIFLVFLQIPQIPHKEHYAYLFGRVLRVELQSSVYFSKRVHAGNSTFFKRDPT